MKDIANRHDIELLVNSFYDKIRQDPTIGFFFNTLMKVNWDTHLPKMYDFWASVLLYEKGYSGSPMKAHFPINAKCPMQKHHFDQWLNLWNDTVDSHFTGEIAQSAKSKAQNIANLMHFKMDLATQGKLPKQSWQ